MTKRIALLGFSIECNRFAPPAQEADFTGRTRFEGAALMAEARAAAPRMLGELPGFVADMDAASDTAGPWEPVPLLLAMGIRLPIVPPTVTMLTGADAPNRPYGELIDLGQRRMREAPYEGRVLNVSVMGGFAYADTPFNGLTAVVTATDAAAARDLAREIAEAGWARRETFRPVLTSLEEAVRLALSTADPSRPALAFADVADNPGGGGRGNTMHILAAFHASGVRDALVGVIHDPALAAEAHALGEGARFAARFNRDGGDAFSHPWEAPAKVRRLHEGRVTGRRGIFADAAIDLGPSAALELGGIVAVVVSNRVQCADPAFLEAFGLDISRARCVVVKSRGHFRGGFDEFFRHDQIVEVDAPGLTSPVLSRFPWKHLPRPVIPLDDLPDPPPAFDEFLTA